MHVPEHLEDLARRIRAAGAPTDFLESSIVEHVSRELGRKHAVEHAAAFVEALNETPGAPRARLWAKADRADVRVYFAGDLGYVSVGWDGSIGGASVVPGRRSQSLTFSPDSLYPAQRRAYRQALEDYRAGLIERSEEHAQERVEKIADLRVALGVDADEDFDDEALERAAERAAWQEAHEGGWGRRNPASPVTASSLGLKKIHNDLYRSPDKRFSIKRVVYPDDGSERWFWRDEVENEGGDDHYRRKWQAVEALDDYMKTTGRRNGALRSTGETIDL